MRKIYALFLFILLGISTSFAQTGRALLSEDFEGDVFPPENWLQKTTVGTTVLEQLEEPDSDPLNHVVGFNMGYSSMDTYLISPLLLPTAQNSQLSFRVRSGVNNYEGRELKVLVSTDYTNVADFSSELIGLPSGASTPEEGITNNWETHTIDLSEYIDQPIYIAFEVLDNDGYINFYFDDIVGPELVKYDNDLQVQSIELPSDYPFVMDGDEIAVSAVVKNNGTNDLNDQEIAFKMGGVTVATETISLPAGEETQVNQVFVGGLGNQFVSVSTPADDFLGNNEMGGSVMFYPADALLESFEGDAFPPVYWTVEGDDVWQPNIYSYITHGSKSVSTYTVGKKLITPKVNILSGDSLCFDAYIYGSVEISTSVDGQQWDVLQSIDLTGVYTSLPYSIKFSDTENADHLGQRYIAFEVVGDYGSLGLDKVYGPAIVPVSDDFEMVDFSISNEGTLYEGDNLSFSLSVQNKGLEAVSKNITLSLNGEVITNEISTGVLVPGEETIVNYTWIADKGYPSADFSVVLESDDFDGNNSKSLSALIYSATPQELPLEMGFEDWTGFPDYWDVTNNGSTEWTVATGNLWTPETTAHSGSAVLDFKAYDGASATLITPNFNLSGEYYKVSFWLFRDNSEYYIDNADKLNVYVNDQPSVEGANLLGTVNRSIALEPVVEGNGWYHYEFWADCRELNEGFFVFEGLSTTSWSNIYIDDLSIAEGFMYDASVDAIKLPSFVWGYQTVANDVTVSVTNKGMQDITNATINWSVNGEAQTAVEWMGLLASGESRDIVIAPDFELPTDETYTVEVNFAVEGETAIDDNDLSVDMELKEAYHIPYTLGFESDETSFEDWTTVDADEDGYNWEISTENAVGGDQLIRSSSFDDATGKALTPDNWLISPAIYVSSDATKMTFDIGSTDSEFFAEKYEILVSESMDLESFTPLLTETLTKTGIENKSVDLGDYKGKIVFVAFRHYDCTEQAFLNLDNVNIFTTNHMVTFNVVANSTPLVNAQISIDGVTETFTTDLEGKVYADLADGTYNYSVSSTEYPTVEGQFTVSGQDLTVDVVLQATAIPKQTQAELQVYPNPFDNQITIDTNKEVKSVAVYNAAGVEIAKQNDLIIQTSNYAKGIYLVVIEFVNGERVVKKLTK
nr:choice-of-anchor J domain-containing protein [uncultured Carboxylicivirga sp.]